MPTITTEQLKSAILQLHGSYGACPTCGFAGKFDTNEFTNEEPESPEGVFATSFDDSIWYNPHTNSWECADCWLK